VSIRESDRSACSQADVCRAGEVAEEITVSFGVFLSNDDHTNVNVHQGPPLDMEVSTNSHRLIAGGMAHSISDHNSLSGLPGYRSAQVDADTLTADERMHFATWPSHSTLSVATLYLHIGA
jgi:hypothetical protein